MTRLAHAWRAMVPEQRRAALAALALLVAMFFPWYGLQSLNRGTINSHTINAFGDVSFVEAAIFLVAVGVLAIVFARAEGRDFHLPGGDGTIATIAGGWAGLLIFYRVFDRPAGHGYPVGIEWGFFVAFVAAGALAYAGWRMRAAERPEAPLRSPDERRRPSRYEDPVDRVRPRAPIDSPAPPVGEEPTIATASPRRSSGRRPAPAQGRPRYPPSPSDPPGGPATAPPRRHVSGADAEQLSFEDPAGKRAEPSESD